MPSIAQNWVKLTEGHFKVYDVIPLGGNCGSAYWVLCPNCYNNIFCGLIKYRNVEKTEVKEIEQKIITDCEADYKDLPALLIDLTKESKCDNTIEYCPYKDIFPSSGYVVKTYSSDTLGCN